MAPKKAKKAKNKAPDFGQPDDVEDSGLGDAPEPAPTAAKPKGSAPKKKKAKKSLKAGDWSDDEAADNTGPEPPDVEDHEEAPAAPRPPAAASSFALLEVRHCI